MEVERYSHVMHLVSPGVAATLARGRRRARRPARGLPGRHRLAARRRSARCRSSTSSSRSQARPLRRRDRLPRLRRRPRHLHHIRTVVVKDGLVARAGRRRHRRRLGARATSTARRVNKAAALLRAVDARRRAVGDGGTSCAIRPRPGDGTRDPRHRQLRLVHLQPRPVPGRARRRDRPSCATTATVDEMLRAAGRRASWSRPAPARPTRPGICMDAIAALPAPAPADPRRLPRPPGDRARRSAGACVRAASADARQDRPRSTTTARRLRRPAEPVHGRRATTRSIVDRGPARRASS